MHLDSEAMDTAAAARIAIRAIAAAFPSRRREILASDATHDAQG